MERCAGGWGEDGGSGDVFRGKLHTAGFARDPRFGWGGGKKKECGAMRGPNKCRDAVLCAGCEVSLEGVKTHHSGVKRNGALQAALAR